MDYQLSHATKLLHNDIYFSIQEEKSQSKMQQLTNWQILNLPMNEIDSNVQYKKHSYLAIALPNNRP